jgi:hypothetical protein
VTGQLRTGPPVGAARQRSADWVQPPAEGACPQGRGGLADETQGRDAGAADRHAWWARRSAAAFNRPSGVVARWTETDEAVRPADWSDVDYLLKATGRLPLSPPDRTALGEAAGWFPLLG